MQGVTRKSCRRNGGGLRDVGELRDGGGSRDMDDQGTLEKKY